MSRRGGHWIELEADPMRIGAVAEYDSPGALRDGVEALRSLGYERLDAYTPFEVPGLDETLGVPRSRIPRVTLVFGLLGAATGYVVQWLCNTVDYPINVGGRPLHPVLAYVPITFETAILFAGVATFVAFFARSRLPETWNPLFEIDGFERASVDRYWLGVDARDRLFHPRETAEALRASGPLRVVLLDEEVRRAEEGGGR